MGKSVVAKRGDFWGLVGTGDVVVKWEDVV